jgi:putative transposase
MQRLKSPAQGQSFLSVHRFIYGHFGPRLHLMAARENRHARAKAFQIWRQETYAQTAA